MIIHLATQGVGPTCTTQRAGLHATSDTTAHTRRGRRPIGPLGTALRLLLGVFLVGNIVYGQIASSGHLTVISWVVGLLGFPVLVLIWHRWRIHRHPARFVATSPVSFVLSLALPLAIYFTGWVAPELWFTSDATILFVGGSLVLAGLHGDDGCEFLALSNWVLRRNDLLACAVLTPIDALERHLRS
jgi:hypothetical protein